MESNQSRRCFHVGGRCKCTETLVPLNELREENLFCDAVLRLEDGGVFPVHRLILSMGSEYFRNLFTTSLNTSEEADILLHGVSSDTMTQILDYVYFREVDIRSDNARQLLVTAEYLRVPGVIELCCDFLMDEMDADNCIGVMQFARCHSIADLETHARRFVLLNFVEVSQKSEELLELPVEELQAVIGSEELNVKDEKVVWECILRWINHDPDNRKGHIADLLKGVRLGRLDAKFFKETTRGLGDAQIPGRRNRLPKEDKEFVTPRIARPRIPQDILFAVGGCRERRPTDVIEAYDARADRWTVVEGVDSIGPRFAHGTAVVGFDVYVIGGCKGEKVLSSCFCFNAVTKTCREVAPMHECRWDLMVSVLRGAVYAMGSDSCPSHRTAERYDRKTNQWSWIAPMNTTRRGASAAALNDKIYVAGGYDCRYCLNLVEVYDPDTDQWTFVAPMLSERTGHSFVAFHGCLYALGGRNKTSERLSTEKYDPTEDTWTEIPDMNFYAYDLNAEVIDDTIFIISRYFDKCVACFDDKDNQWHQAADFNVCRHGISTCVIRNLPNARDYAYKHRD